MEEKKEDDIPDDFDIKTIEEEQKTLYKKYTDSFKKLTEELEKARSNVETLKTYPLKEEQVLHLYRMIKSLNKELYYTELANDHLKKEMILQELRNKEEVVSKNDKVNILSKRQRLKRLEENIKRLKEVKDNINDLFDEFALTTQIYKDLKARCKEKDKKDSGKRKVKQIRKKSKSKRRSGRRKNNKC